MAYQINRTEEIAYTASQMYDLVNDVANYPKFIPWCTKTEIKESSSTQMLASLTFELKGIKKTFTTSNCLQPGYLIEMHLIEGPFDFLSGTWEFANNQKKGCYVTFNLNFKVKSSLLNNLFESMFSSIVNQFMDLFIKQAHERYGSHLC